MGQFDFRYLFLLGVLLAVGGVYSLGLGGDFIFDDRHNILLNEAVHISGLSLSDLLQVLSSGIASSVGRPVAMLTFGINHVAWGLDPYWFKVVNVAIHLFNGVLLYQLLSMLLVLRSENTEREDGALTRYLPLLVTFIWLAHPLLVSSVLYIVQRMVLLAATFTFLALIFYIKFRLAPKFSLAFVYGSLFVLSTVLGVLSKENAALIPLFTLAIDYYFIRRRFFYSQVRSLLGLYYFVCLFIPLLYVLWFSIFQFDWSVEHFVARDFSPYERVLTQSRLIFEYVVWILLPNLNQYGFFHDDFVVSRSVLQPVTTLLSIVALGIVLLGLVLLKRKMALVGFGVAFFLAGHVLESSFWNLEMVFEHRNYLPGIGLILALFGCLEWIMERASSKGVVWLLIGSYGLYALAMTGVRASEWGNSYHFTRSMADTRPLSARAQHRFALWNFHQYTIHKLGHGGSDKKVSEEEVEEYWRQGELYAMRALEARYAHVASLQALIHTALVTGKPLHQEWVDELARRSRDSIFELRNSEQMRHLALCLREDRCRMPEVSLAPVFEALLSNETVLSKFKAAYYIDFAVIRKLEGAPEGVIQSMLKNSIALYPLPSAYSWIVSSFLFTGDKAQAQYYFDKARNELTAEEFLQVRPLKKHIFECCNNNYHYGFK